MTTTTITYNSITKHNPFIISDHIQLAMCGLEDFCETQRATTATLTLANPNHPFGDFTVVIQSTKKAIGDNRFDSHLDCFTRFHDLSTTVNGNVLTAQFTLTTKVMDYKESAREYLLSICVDLANSMKKRIAKYRSDWSTNLINPSDYQSLRHLEQGLASIVEDKRSADIDIRLMSEFVDWVGYYDQGLGNIDSITLEDFIFEILTGFQHQNYNNAEMPTRLSHNGNLYNLKQLAFDLVKAIPSEDYQVFTTHNII